MLSFNKAEGIIAAGVSLGQGVDPAAYFQKTTNGWSGAVSVKLKLLVAITPALQLRVGMFVLPKQNRGIAPGQGPAVNRNNVIAARPSEVGFKLEGFIFPAPIDELGIADVTCGDTFPITVHWRNPSIDFNSFD